jgi:hypothetical protein
MRGASRGVLEVEQPDRAGAENSAGFCLGRRRDVSRAGVRRPRLRLASEGSGSLGTWPCGITTALRGARWTGTGRRRVTPAITRVPGSPDLGFKSAARANDAKPQDKPAGGSRAGVERRKARAFRQRRWRRKMPIHPCASRRSTSPHVAREGPPERRRTRRRKEYGCISASTRVLSKMCAPFRI